MYDALTRLSSRVIGAPKGPKGCRRGGCVRGKLVDYLVNEGFHSNDTKKGLTFVALVAGCVDLEARGRSVKGRATKVG